MANPFSDDDNDAAAANKSAVEKVERAASEPNEDDEIRITLPEPGEEEDDEPAVSAKEELSRKERRRNRYREAQDEAAEERRRRLELEDENRRLRAQPASQYQQAPVANELDAAYDRICDEQNALFEQYNNAQAAAKNALPKDKVDEFEKKARDLEKRRSEVLFVRNQRVHGPNLAEEAEKNRLRAQYADVYGHKTADGRSPATMYAQGVWAQRIARDGEPKNPAAAEALLEECMNEARKEFRLPGYQPKVTEADRQRYAGASRGVGGRGPERRPTVTMTREYRQMATAMYPKDEPAKAYQKWANGPGRKLLDLKA